MRHTMLVCENSLLQIAQMPHNSDMLINKLIDAHNRLLKEY